MGAQVNITDRAKRYRAQSAVTGPRKCVMCGGRSDLQVMHLTGNEDHGEPANLAYGCRSCNGKLSVAFKALNLGRPTNQFNPAKATVPTFEQYMWAVSNHTRGAHDDGGKVIHATPKHKRIEYAKRIVSKAQATKRERFDDRWNPGASPHATGWEAARLGMDRSKALKDYLEFVSKERSVSPVQRKVMTKLFNDGYRAGGKLNSATSSNPWPFSSRQAPIPATGGIAHHTRGIGRAKTEAAKDTASGSHKGYKISRTDGGEFFSSLDPQSWFETKAQAKAHIDRHLKGRVNPTVRFKVVKRGDHDYRLRDSSNGRDLAQQFGTRARAQQEADKLNREKSNPAAASAEVFEDFHGFPSSEVVKVTKEVHHHAHLAALGKLVLLEVYGVDGQGHKIQGFKGALLCCNEDRNQLFIEGGDQSMNLADFGIKAKHELETLGQVTNIGYQTNKTHLGDEGGNAVYVHRFRATNQNGKHVVVKMTREPDLIYDRRNEQLLFSGGSYEILREGINK